MRHRQDHRAPKGFDPARKYLVIVPLLSEVERVRQHASVPFIAPDTNKEFANKSNSLGQLLRDGRNIVTTHALYTIIAQLAREGFLRGYDVIIDEVLDVVSAVDGVTPTSWKRFYVILAMWRSTVRHGDADARMG